MKSYFFSIVFVFVLVAGGSWAQVPLDDIPLSSPDVTVIGPGPGPIHHWFIATDGDDVAGDGSVGNPFASLNRAVGIAAFGDTVEIADGIYSGAENCNVYVENKSLNIWSTSEDAGACVFELGGEDGFHFQKTEYDLEMGLNLSGVTFQGGGIGVFAAGWMEDDGPQLISLDIEKCQFLGNSTGLKVSYASLLIEDCVFLTNTTVGLDLDSNAEANVEIFGCHFEQNGFGMKNGYQINDILDVNESVFVRNETGFRLSLESASSHFTSCRMDSNSLDGFVLSGGCSGVFTFTDCNIVGNNRYGGHLVEQVLNLTINNSQILENGSDGLAVDSTCGTVSLTNVQLENNGGLGFFFGGNGMSHTGPSITGCTISNNQLGGVQCIGNDAFIGETQVVDNGGIGLEILEYSSGPGEFELSNTTIAGNDGAGIKSDHTQATITNTIIAFNTGPAATLTNSPTLTMSCNDIYGNSTDYEGDLQGHQGINGNINTNPAFCGMDNENPYTLTQYSPCAEENNPTCGQIGALAIGCEYTLLTCYELQSYNPQTGQPSTPHQNEIVTVEGVVYTPPGTYSATGGGYLQDETGGINFYRWSYPEPINEGQRIRITGPLWEYESELYISDFVWTVLETNVQTVPVIYTVSELLSDFHHVGSFVSVTAQATNISTDSFWLTDGQNQIEVTRVDYTGVSYNNITEGSTWTVLSPCFNYLGTMRLSPQRQTDLIALSDWAILAPTSDIEEDLGCSNALPVTFHFEPALTTPAVKGYSVQVIGDDNVSFVASDITVLTVPSGESPFHQIIENGPNDFTIDYTILGPETPGITSAADLFSINLHGQAEGWGNVSVIAADFRDLENQSLAVDFSTPASVFVDCTLPEQVTGVTAAPGHEKVTLNWVDPGDTDLSGIFVYRAYWENGSGASAYPVYGLPGGDEIPARPIDNEAAEASSQWIFVGEVPPGAQAFVDSVSDRGVLFYEFFSRDNASNSAAPADDQAFATNYWLGDIDASRDGRVTVADLTYLGATYGISTGHALYNNEGDVGPTDDGSGFGIPQPDGYVGFDDLMIVSLNYGGVNPDKSDFHSNGSIYLAWEKVSDMEWVCRLESSGGSLKGLHVEGNLPSGVTATCSAGSLIGRQTGPVFLRNVDQNSLDLGLAVMGQGVFFEEQGELFRVILSAPADLSGVVIEARGAGNEVVAVNVESSSVPPIPLRHQLHQNFPNPFNPFTTVSFDLPQDAIVRVSIYSLDGRLVRILASERFEAGSHDLVWMGADDAGRRVASGTYFCRMISGEFDQIRKMVLAK